MGREMPNQGDGGWEKRKRERAERAMPVLPKEVGEER